jgi:hypothetical protein
MIEIFKTNVNNYDQAGVLLERIHRIFVDYRANFDLEDCDRILRVKCINGAVHPLLLINLLKNCGFNAEILADEINS